MRKINKKNVIKHSGLHELIPSLVPSKTKVPDWYKNAKKHLGEKDIIELPANLGFKYCSSFQDAFLTGYMIPLPVDIAVKQTEGGPSVSWADLSTRYLQVRERETNETLPTPEGFSDVHFVWETQLMFKIPKGYSILLTHPLNRVDLPFFTLSGIVDGEFVMQNGNVPVFFSKTFEGIIPAGTPIAQIIPFKTEDWDSQLDSSILEEGHKNSKKSTMAAYGWYKKNLWKKKKYD